MNTSVQKIVSTTLALGVAAAAQAVPISTVPAGNILYISGSTSMDPILKAYATNSTSLFCDATLGTIDFYTGRVDGLKFTAVACAAGSGAFPVSAGTSIAYIKEDNGESLNGIKPVANASAVPYPDFTTLDAITSCSTTPPQQPSGEQIQTLHFCNPSNPYGSTQIAPNLGFSDVEAAIFGASPANTTAFPTIDVIFAPAVSLGLYHALQNVQGLGNTDTIADVPSLTRAQMTAIFTGYLSDWASVKSPDGKTVGSQSVAFGNSNLTPRTSTNHVCWDGTAFSTAADCQSGTQGPVEAPSASSIYICQKGQSSGRQQALQIFMGDLGCSAGVISFNIPRKPGTTCAADGCSWMSTYNTILNFAGQDTSDVLECLEAHDEQGQFALGFASTADPFGVYQADPAEKDFRYIRVDGVMPSIENAAADRYRLWTQALAYLPAVGSSNYPTGVAGEMVSVFLFGATGIGNVGAIAALNPALQYTAPAFDGGVLAIPSTAVVPNPGSATLATFQSHPVNSFTRANAGGSPNNCQSPYLSGSAPDVAVYPLWASP